MWFVTWSVGFTPGLKAGTLSLIQVARRPLDDGRRLVGTVTATSGPIRSDPMAPER
jgi:hypothetical protein